jgi:hypothetical protein
VQKLTDLSDMKDQVAAMEQLGGIMNAVIDVDNATHRSALQAGACAARAPAPHTRTRTRRKTRKWGLAAHFARLCAARRADARRARCTQTC